MSSRYVNYLNVALILGSAAIAVYVPFQLFLFAYAVLGPLHYLTEISWLHGRSYYVPNAKAVWAFPVLCLAILTLGYFSPTAGLVPLLVIATYVYACLLQPHLTRRSTYIALTLLCLLGVLCFLPSALYAPFMILGILLPTLIHVAFFTACFMLVGALKERSPSAYLACIVFLLVGASLFILPVPDSGMDALRFQSLYAPFIPVNSILLSFTHPLSAFTTADIFTSGAGLSVMRFVAFAYTYHYLNWFSKTSFIGWHRVSRPRALLILGLWTFSLIVYFIDYSAGFSLLLFLSLLHVLLEFPLNHATLRTLHREIRMRVAHANI